MFSSCRNTLLILIISVVCFSCDFSEKNRQNTLFNKLPPSQTGIAFKNQLTENETFNILNYLYFFNGGGVAVADLNNDGLPEIFFTANMESDKLYLNKGNMQFEDISKVAGIDLSNEWSTGVNFADVNGDGWQDIYVCRVGGGYRGFEGSNKLYIHQGLNEAGIPTFKEVAEQFGLAFSGFSTHAAFLDYDNDGDLDMYLLNHSVHTESSYGPGEKLRNQSDPKAGDRLFENQLNTGKIGFKEVTQQAGILNSQIGYGLGIAITDINQDGFADIYIGNDFHENDYLYLNNGNGTFSESLQKIAKHSSRFTMGVDAADFNNDALTDLITLDMKPEYEEILKASAPEDSYEIFSYKLNYGYAPQFARNNLQLNQGIAEENKLPLMSEIGQLAGVDATDWSWSALFCDFDNNGYKDLFISNGIFRRPNDMDYLKHISDDNIKRSLNSGVTEDNLNVILQMPSVPIANYAYSNSGSTSGFNFTDSTKQWGLDEKGFSNGAVYADLDNDGDQDLIINNLNTVASIYQNNAEQKAFKVSFLGEKGNPTGIGTKVLIEHQGQRFYQENFPARGFQSSVNQELLFGLGNVEDSLINIIHIFWPNGKYQKFTNFPFSKSLKADVKEANQLLTFREFIEKEESRLAWFEQVQLKGINWEHRENEYSDFNVERLMPHLLSTQGPALAVVDVDGNGLDDVFFGGAAGHRSEIYVQVSEGNFKPSNLRVFELDKDYEDVEALFFDADNDGDQDLLVATGGNQYARGSDILQDRLYINNGRGTFRLATDALPNIKENTGTISTADFDADGDQDILIGTRNIPGAYGISANAYLLENDGKGKFTEATKKYAPQLANIGMLTSAIWIQKKDSPYPDLVLVGEWMPLQYFKNENGKLSLTTDSTFKDAGWWQSLTAVDLDQDGDQDIVAGNLGENTFLHASENEPMQLIVKDFDKSGSIDPIIAMYHTSQKGAKKLYPLYGRDAYVEQMSYIRKSFPTYTDYAGKTLQEVFPVDENTDFIQKEITELASVVYINEGNGSYKKQELPKQVQTSPLLTSLIYDLNSDGILDLITAGNFYGVKPLLGQYDAGVGTVVLSKKNASFQTVPNKTHGLFLDKEIRNMAVISVGIKDVLVATVNHGTTVFFEIEPTKK